VPTWQIIPAPQLAFGGQQGCLFPPHATQVPALQKVALLQLSPAQQGCVAPPHAWHVPVTQTVPAWQAAPCGQQG
jgi:hypothetical protein